MEFMVLRYPLQEQHGRKSTTTVEECAVLEGNPLKRSDGGKQAGACLAARPDVLTSAATLQPLFSTDTPCGFAVRSKCKSDREYSGQEFADFLRIFIHRKRETSQVHIGQSWKLHN